MSIYVIDYFEEVKNLISETYENADLVSKEFEYTTEVLTELLQKVLPYKAIDEDLVYRALKTLNFKPNEIAPLAYIWYFKRKQNF